MSALSLKLIAIAAMTIDHLGYAIFPDVFILRWIGRLTFPIMAYFIGVGYSKTSDLKKYMITLAAFALLSEIPFNLMAGGSLYGGGVNVLVTLLLGLVAIEVYQRFRYARWGYLVVIIPALVADILHSDYGGGGVYLIFALWHFADYPKGPLWCIGIWSGINFLSYWASAGLSLTTLTPLLAIATVPLIGAYNGSKGYRGYKPVLKYIFYLYYPLHMLVIALLAKAM